MKISPFIFRECICRRIGMGLKALAVTGVLGFGVPVLAEAPADDASFYMATTNPAEPATDAQSIRDNFAVAIAALNAQDATLFGSYISDSYLNNGETKADMLGYLQSPDWKQMFYSSMDTPVQVSDSVATALIHWTGDTPETMTFRKESGNWVLYGNQLKYRVECRTRHFKESGGSDQFTLSLEIEDSGSAINSVGVTGPGITGTASLNFQAGNDNQSPSWVSWSVDMNTRDISPVFNLAQRPAVGTEYTFTIHEKTGGTVTHTSVIKGYVDAIATNLSPTDRSTITTARPTFSWDSDAQQAEIELFAVPEGDTHNYIWGTNETAVSSPLTYSGPALQSGTTYCLHVKILDMFGNESQVSARFLYRNSLDLITQTITVKSDASVLAAVTDDVTKLDSGDTTGLTFQAALPGDYGTYSPVPAGAPTGTIVINIPPILTQGVGRDGFFKATFTLPAGFTNPQISGKANVDDVGRIFLNGNPISSSLNTYDGGRVSNAGDTAFSTSSASYFKAGVNELLVSDSNSGGGPSGAAFYANVTFQSEAGGGTPVAPSITSQPVSQTVAIGEEATFNAEASGSPVPTWQWQVSTDGGANWSNIKGATEDTYFFTATLGDNGKQFRAVATNTADSASSGAATLTVRPPPDSSVQFADEFDSVTLDSAWQVIPYTGPRTYNYSSPANHYSLTERPGALRYYVDPMTTGSGWENGWQKVLSTYWYDPGLELRRPFSGADWTLETKFAYYLPLTNGRGFSFNVVFGDPTDGNPYYTASFGASRDSGYSPDSRFSAGLFLYTPETKVSTNLANKIYNDGRIDAATRHLRLVRSGNVLTAAVSMDGIRWEQVYSQNIGSALDGLQQTILIRGSSWFNSAGSYAEWDYVRLTPANSQQHISFPILPVKKVGDMDFAPGVTASSGLPVSCYSSNASVASIRADGLIHIVGTGTTTITASQPGNAGYAAATPVARTLTVRAGKDAVFYMVSKVKRYTQPTAGAPALGDYGGTDYFGFFAGLLATEPDAINGVSITKPGGIAASLAGNDGWWETDDDNGNTYNWTTSAAMDAAFPNGTYTMTITPAYDNGGSPLTATLSLSGDAYPPAPVISNWAALQATSAASPVTVKWKAWAGGIAADFIHVIIEDVEGAYWESPMPGTDGCPNGTATQIVVPAGILTTGKQYYCEVTFLKMSSSVNMTAYPGVPGVACYMASTVFPLALTATPPVAPIFNTSPLAALVTAGQTASFTAAASGMPVPTYQWQVSADAGTTWNEIPGADSATCSLTAAGTDNGKQFRCVATNSAGSANSRAATLSVRVSLSAEIPDGGGTVTGTGVYLPGTRVVLTAKPAATYTFIHWENGSSAATRDFVIYNENMTVSAYFDKVVEILPPVIGDPGAQDAMVGVPFVLPLNITSSSLETVTVKGLPTGLIYNATAKTITGIPTKDGIVTVTVAAKNASPTATVKTFVITVAALPDWAKGNFSGSFNITEDDDYGNTISGPVTMSVTAQGKITGKLVVSGTNAVNTYTFVAASYMQRDEEGSLWVTGNVTSGKEVHPLTMRVSAIVNDVAPNLSAMDGWFATADAIEGEQAVKMYRNVWKDADMSAEADKYDGYYTATLPGDGSYGSGYLTFTVDKIGGVKSGGKLADGTSVSMAGTLILDEFGRVFTMLYTAPTAYMGGYLFGLVEFLTQEDANAPVIVRLLDATPFTWKNQNPKATAEYGIGFLRAPELLGGWYSKTIDLLQYYNETGLTIDGVELPALLAAVKTTDINPDSMTEPPGKITTTEVMPIESTGIGPNGLMLKVVTKATTSGISGIGLAAPKADTPVKNAITGEYDYSVDTTADGVVNTSGLMLNFTRATGLFKGSFKAWYDYASAVDNTTGIEKPTHAVKTVSIEGALTPVTEQGVSEGCGFFLWMNTSSYDSGRVNRIGDPIFTPYNYNESYDIRLLGTP